MASRLTVITGPPGVDIGAAAAVVGRRLGDGLAVRVVDSGRERTAHTSSDPFHAQADGTPGAVRLRYLPSAWQNPDTNLGVVFTRAALPVSDDVHTLAALGLNPSHRLTIQAKLHTLSPGHAYAAPIEIGDVGVHARDAVLRAGGHVLVEAGDGMTHLEALAALNLPPWAPWIDSLDLWSVFDMRDWPLLTVAQRVAEGLTTLGGTVDVNTIRERSRVVLTGADGMPDNLHPVIREQVYQSAGGGIDRLYIEVDELDGRV